LPGQLRIVLAQAGGCVEAELARFFMNSAPLSALNDAFARCRDMDASLDERLAAYSSEVRSYLPDYADAVDRLVERLSCSGAGEAAPRPGDPMPAFVLPDASGRLVSLDSLLQGGPIAVTFHRGHWCPWCRISGSALARVARDITGAGGQVAARSLPTWTMAMLCR
jgi:AhpC/TSA family